MKLPKSVFSLIFTGAADAAALAAPPADELLLGASLAVCRDEGCWLLQLLLPCSIRALRPGTLATTCRKSVGCRPPSARRRCNASRCTSRWSGDAWADPSPSNKRSQNSGTRITSRFWRPLASAMSTTLSERPRAASTARAIAESSRAVVRGVGVSPGEAPERHWDNSYNQWNTCNRRDGHHIKNISSQKFESVIVDS